MNDEFKKETAAEAVEEATEVPAEITPTEDIPSEEAPIEVAPVEDIPCGDIPCEDIPCEDIPCGEAPIEIAPVEDVPCGEAPAEEAPIEIAPVEDAPAEEAPIEIAPVEDIPCGEAPAEEAPIEIAPAEDIPCEEAPVEVASAEKTEECCCVECAAPVAPASVVAVDEQAPKRGGLGFSIASLIVGVNAFILSWFGILVVYIIPTIILSIVGLCFGKSAKKRNYKGKMNGFGKAFNIIALVFSILAIVLVVGLFIFMYKSDGEFSLNNIMAMLEEQMENLNLASFE